MIPRNQSRLSRHRRSVKNQFIKLFIMFMTFVFWTGYILFGFSQGLWLEDSNLLAVGLPIVQAEQTQSNNLLINNQNQGNLLMKIGQAAMQSLLGVEASNTNLPWVGMELVWSQALVNNVKKLTSVSASTDINYNDAFLEEDYTLLEDPYASKWPNYPDNNVLVLPEGEPRLLIYHTHNSESYTVNSASKNNPSGILGAGRVLTQALESKFGIKIAHSQAINDRPDFTKSYLNSFNVVNQYLKKYPNLEMVIDLHRDAGFTKRTDTLVTINGRSCAKLLLVIGNAHENYKDNLAFARKIQAKADNLYPGLMKPLRIAEQRRYNQQLHAKAFLLEVGSNLNYQADADNSMVLFADVLAQVLEEE